MKPGYGFASWRTSARWLWMVASMSSAGAKPIERARAVSKLRGQLPTIASIIGSGSKVSRPVSPPARPSAATISETRTLMPGTLTVRHCVGGSPTGAASAKAVAGKSRPCSIAWLALSGEPSHSSASGLTGQTAGVPASGSRKMLLAKPLAALLGLPGRMLT